MLHRIKPPDCGDRLNQIVQFQLRVLTFVCSGRVSLPLTESSIRNELKSAGDWFWRKLWVRRNTGNIGKSKLHKEFERAVRYLNTHPDIAPQLLEAFNHDLEIADHLDDSDFRFSYSGQLTKATQKAIRGVLQAFYSELLASGFPSSVHGHANNFNRDDFVASFYRANPKLSVCSACDGARADTVDTKTYADADHFFPKSLYPFFSVHLENLVPICLQCNRSFKLDRDPIDEPDEAPLTNTFHPYRKPAIDHIQVSVSRNATGLLEVVITEHAGMPSRRISSLNRVFRLEKRWTTRLPAIIERIRADIAKQGRRRNSRGESVDEEILKDGLKIYPDEYERGLGKFSNHILESSYLRFVADDRNEFEELLRYFQMK
jgi:hypothetical protein